MSRLLAAALVLFLVGLAAYTGSFYATRSVLAHGQHCGVPTPYLCRTYFAGQKGNGFYFTNGLKGSINWQDVALRDNTNDTAASWLGMFDYPDTDRWGSMGVVEGRDPFGNVFSYVRWFYEVGPSDICGSYVFQGYGPPSTMYNPEYPEIAFYGQTGFCSPTGSTYYVYWISRQGSAPLAAAHVGVSRIIPEAASEHKNSTHMEPNGLQCFGTFSSCSGQFGLWVWDRNLGYWDPWSSGAQVVEGYGYSHNPITQWSSFTTTSTW